jgi:hypothetical protein
MLPVRQLPTQAVIRLQANEIVCLVCLKKIKIKLVCLVGVACLCLLDSQVCRQTYHNCVDSELLMPCKTERLDETMTLRTNVTYTVWLLGQGTLPTNLSDQDLFNSL